jgi:hypothetical protein
MCQRATLTIFLREGRPPSAVTTASSRTESLGPVPSTSEGSLGPAVAPWVKVPCDGVPCNGESLASEFSEKANSETNKADTAAKETVTDTNNSRRISPPPRTPNRVARHCNSISTQMHQYFEDFLEFFTGALRPATLSHTRLAKSRGRGPIGPRPQSLLPGSNQAPASSGSRTAGPASGSESQREISTLFSVKKRTPSLPVACRSP